MIPASYLFKDAFQKTWYEPDIEDAVERHQHTTGPSLMARLWSRITTLGRPASAAGFAAPAAKVKV